MLKRQSPYLIIILLLVLKNDLFCIQKESPHFIFYYEAKDSSVIDTIKLKLENSFSRITNDLQLRISEKIKVHIYPSLQEFHNAIGYPNAPDWLVGIGNVEIYAVSPLNPGPVHSYNSVVNNVFIHEFTHVCTEKINSNLPLWLNEGFASYEGGPYYEKTSVITVYKKLGRMPTLDELNNYSNFSSIGGYPFSLTIAYFIIDKFGLESMRMFISQPDNFSVFSGLTKSDFQSEWYKYFEEKYLVSSSPVPSGSNKNDVKNNYNLEQNYPNPFNSETIIRYNIENIGEIEIVIYNSTGEKVLTLAKLNQNAGQHTVNWNGVDNSGRLAPSGIYICNLRANHFTCSRKMILLK